MVVIGIIPVPLAYNRHSLLSKEGNMNIQEACKALNLSRSSLYQKISQGELETKNDNGKRLIYVQQVQSDLGLLIAQLKSENQYCEVSWLKPENIQTRLY